VRPSIFLLSPADCSGKRASLLQDPGADFELAKKLQSPEGASLGDVFAFTSSLYFRGKLAYARAFSRPPRGESGVLVITPGDGLKTPETPITVSDLHRFGRVPVDPAEKRYREPLFRDARLLASRAEADVVLLGSIASPKYTEILIDVFPRLLFPEDFVGRGDMSRGGLLLRCARENRELRYVALRGATLHGSRPARLPPLARS
jgi:hypothetical protein